MTQPFDLHFDCGPRRPILPLLAFYAALLVLAAICGSLHGRWWHFGIGVLAVWLVRVTTKAQCV